MQLQIFKYQSEEEQMFNEIRTIEQEDGSILFCALDVAKMLGYSNPHDAISKHCKYLVKCEVPHPQNPKTWFYTRRRCLQAYYKIKTTIS